MPQNTSKKNIKQNIGLFFILLLGFVSLTWFKPGSFIVGGDNIFYLNPLNVLKNVFYIWDSHLNLGQLNLQTGAIFPFWAFWKMFSLLGIDQMGIERIWIYTLFTLPGISMYFLVKKTVINKKIPAFLAAWLYMLNIFVAVDVTQFTVRPVQALLPLSLLLWIKALRQIKHLWIYPALLALSSIFYASSATNPSSIGSVLVIFLAYLLFHILFYKVNWRNLLITSFLTLLFILLVNAWWLSTSLVSMFAVGENIQSATGSYSAGATPLAGTFRFMEFWAFRGTTEDVAGQSVALIPFAKNYFDSWLVFTTYLVSIIAILVITFLGRRKKIYLFFLCLSAIGIFFAKGSAPPLAVIFNWLYSHIPGFWVFRDPYAKFTLIHLLGFSVLLGLTGYYIIEKAVKHKLLKIIVFALFFTILSLNTYPLLTGEAIQNKKWYNDSMRTLHVKVPDYWQDAISWFKANTGPDDLVMLTPQLPYGHCLKWESGICGSDPVAFALLKNNLIRSPFLPNQPIDLFIAKFYENLLAKNLKFKQVLSLLGVRYILQDNDVYWQKYAFNEVMTPEETARLWSNQNLQKFLTFGSLDIYAPNTGNQPPVFSAKSLRQNFSSSEKIFEYLLFEPLGDKEVLASSEYKFEYQTLKPIDIVSLKINNPTNYQIKVKPITEPADFVLVLKQKFDPGWQLKSKQIPNQQITHFPAYGFLNGWFVKNAQGDITITIEHKLQKTLWYFGLVSAFSVFSLLVLLLGYKKFKK